METHFGEVVNTVDIKVATMIADQYDYTLTSEDTHTAKLKVTHMYGFSTRTAFFGFLKFKKV
jgi:hypothetical protein